MRKIATQSLTILLILLVPCLSFAKKKSEAGTGPFHKNSKSLGLYLGAGTNYGYGWGGLYSYYGSGWSGSPSLGLTYDQGIMDNVGPGNIGVGGTIVYKAYNYNFSGDKYYDRTYTIATRATYHTTILNKWNNKFDPYGGVSLGVRFSHLYTSYDNYTSNETDFVAGIFVGAKYHFAPNFAAFSELGYDIALFKVGIALNF